MKTITFEKVSSNLWGWESKTKFLSYSWTSCFSGERIKEKIHAELCFDGMRKYFEIPRGTKEIDVSISKRKMKDSYKVKLDKHDFLHSMEKIDVLKWEKQKLSISVALLVMCFMFA